MQTKVQGQIAALNQNNTSCKGAFFSKEIEKESVYNEFIDLVPFEKAPEGYLKPIKHYHLLMKSMYNYLIKKEPEYDVIYMRYPGAGKGLLKIATAFGSKICLEHNSKETEEIKGQKNQHLPVNSLGKLLSWYHYVYHPLAMERKYAPKIFSKIKLATCVSKEMANYETLRAKSSNYKCVPIGNGIDVNRIPLRNAPEFNGSELNLLFLKGTSGLAPWNGIERLIHSMEHYNGDIKVSLYIAGKYIENEIQYPKKLNDNIHFAGYLNGEQLDNLFDKCHIAVGTLAFYKSNQYENATLKVREYFARGIPFIYAYTDFDLENIPEGKQFTLQFPNDNSVIDMNNILKFGVNALKNKNHPAQMREYATEHFDYKVKMAQLQEILKQHFN